MHVHDLLTLIVLCARYPNGVVYVMSQDHRHAYYEHAECATAEEVWTVNGEFVDKIEFYKTAPAEAMNCAFCGAEFNHGNDYTLERISWSTYTTC